MELPRHRTRCKSPFELGNDLNGKYFVVNLVASIARWCRSSHARPSGRDLIRKPVVAETTAQGAAYAAGLAVGFWESPDDLRANWREDNRWTLNRSDDERASGYGGWQKAVQRTLDRADVD